MFNVRYQTVQFGQNNTINVVIPYLNPGITPQAFNLHFASQELRQFASVSCTLLLSQDFPNAQNCNIKMLIRNAS